MHHELKSLDIGGFFDVFNHMQLRRNDNSKKKIAEFFDFIFCLIKLSEPNYIRSQKPTL